MNDFMQGLLSKQSEPIPLVGVEVQADILGRGTKVSVWQRFKNTQSKALEAIYKFPLPEGAAVCGFKARIDEQVIEGRVEEREKAFEIYDDALSEGDGAYLMDEERPNIFTLSVGNLNPGSEVVVEIKYVALLDMEDTKTRFFLPTTVSPRYTPESIDEEDGIPETSKVNPVYALDVPYGLSLCLRIHGAGSPKTIESPSHPIKVAMDKNPIQVEFSSDSVAMDRDFILYVEPQESFSSGAYCVQTNDETFLQLDLLLTNESAASSTEKEIIFVLDCSGSMSGQSIEEAKKALEVCLKGLDPGTTFNIFRFGSTYEHLFDFSSAYDRQSLAKALDYLKSVDADLGGTEIYAPLEHIYRTQPDRNRNRDIVLLTDGEVANEDEILRLVRTNNDDTRFFSLGIGTGPNEYLIKGLARSGRGSHEFIHPNERIEPKVIRLYNDVKKKSLDDLCISWGNKTVDQAPASGILLFDKLATFFARLKSCDAFPEYVTISAKVDGEERIWNLSVENCSNVGLPVPLLWAREQIRSLEEGEFSHRGSRQVEKKRKRAKRAVIELSRQYGILSRSTSYVAVEVRTEQDKTKDEAVLAKVPVLVTAGWHGFGGMFRTGSAAFASMAPLQFLSCRSICGVLGKEWTASAEQPYSDDTYLTTSRFQAFKSKLSKLLFRDISAYETSEKGMDQYKSTENKTDVLLMILSSQRPEGGFELTEENCESLGLDFGDLKTIVSEINLTGVEDPFTVLSTAILLETLEQYFSDDQATWFGITQKTRDWLEGLITAEDPQIQGQRLMAWAKDYVHDSDAVWTV